MLISDGKNNSSNVNYSCIVQLIKIVMKIEKKETKIQVNTTYFETKILQMVIDYLNAFTHKKRGDFHCFFFF